MQQKINDMNSVEKVSIKAARKVYIKLKMALDVILFLKTSYIQYKELNKKRINHKQYKRWSVCIPENLT